MESPIVNLTDADFAAAVADGITVVDFWAGWCGPCRAMAPIFERAAQELEPKARFVKVNVDNEPELAQRLGVQGIPALFVLKHGSVVARQAGLANLATLQNWVRQYSPV